MPAPFRTKIGEHGTLYRFAVPYSGGEGHSAEWQCWAYDAEHARDKFEESDEGEGWKVTCEPRKLREGVLG